MDPHILSHNDSDRHLSALRGVLTAARKLHLTSVTDCQDALDEATTIKGSRVPTGRSLTAGELQALLNACANDDSPAGARDAAIIGLLYGSGLRRAEVVALDRESFREDGSLIVRGKRNKERQLYVEGGAQQALADWLMLRGNEPGPLFFRIRRGGHVKRLRLTPQAVLHIVTQRRRQAQVAKFTPHDLRRTVAGDLLDAGEDIVTVQKILGHSSPATTARYDRRPETAKRKAQQKVHVPYISRWLLRTEEETS